MVAVLFIVRKSLTWLSRLWAVDLFSAMLLGIRNTEYGTERARRHLTGKNSTQAINLLANRAMRKMSSCKEKKLCEYIDSPHSKYPTSLEMTWYPRISGFGLGRWTREEL